MHWRASSIVAVAVLLSSCSNDRNNPFSAQTRPPSAQAVAVFVSSSWAGEATGPVGRELMAVDANGANGERLTNCGQNADPCDVQQVSISPVDVNRVALIKSTASAAPGTAALYFVDLGRSAEKLIFPRKRVNAVDWAPDASYLVYSSPGDTGTGAEELFYCSPDGSKDQNLTSSTGIRERSPRTDPLGRTVAFEAIDSTGVSRIYLFSSTPVAITTGPATGPALPGTPYVVGGDADPAFSPAADKLVFRRLTGIGNGGLGTWDLVTAAFDGSSPAVIATGAVARSAPDWGQSGILFVETDAAAAVSRLVVIQPDGSGRRVLREENAAFGMAAPRWIPRRTLPAQ